MKAAVYFGSQDIRCTNIPDPVIRADHEVLVKVHATSICGSDLHLYRGALDAMMEKGKSQTGHELVGEVLDVGKSVSRFKKAIASAWHILAPAVIVTCVRLVRPHTAKRRKRLSTDLEFPLVTSTARTLRRW